MKVRAAGAILLGILAAFALTYTIHFSPFGFSPRFRPFGVAQTQLLVDSDPSPLADVYLFIEADNSLAFTLAEIGNSPEVRGAAARAVGQPVSSIGVTEQGNDQNVPRSESDAEEAQAGDTLLSDGRQYSVFLRVDAQSFVIQIFTQAPSGSAAIRMGNAVADALESFTSTLVAKGRVPGNSRVILRQIFPAYGGDVDRDIGPESFVALALFFVILCLIALLSVVEYIARDRSVQQLAVR